MFCGSIAWFLSYVSKQSSSLIPKVICYDINALFENGFVTFHISYSYHYTSAMFVHVFVYEYISDHVTWTVV